MPSKTKKQARRKSSGSLPIHPAMAGGNDCMVNMRLGVEDALRLPDDIMDPSAATVLRNEYTISADAAGYAAWAENQSLAAALGQSTITAGSTAVPTYTAHPQAAAFYTESAVARMIAMKIQVTYIGAEATAAGYLSFTEKTSATALGPYTMDALHTGSHSQVRADDGMLVFVDYAQTPRYELASGNTFMSGTFPAALFVASGLPVSTPVFRVRVLRFMEYMPAEGSLAEGETRHEPPNPGSMAAHGALSAVGTSVSSGKSAAGFLSRVKQVANAAYHLAQPLVPYVAAEARQFLINNGPALGGLAIKMI